MAQATVIRDFMVALGFKTDNSGLKQMQDAIKIRRGAKATITNALIKGTGAALDLVDFTDGKGAGDATSSINLTNQLTNPILGKTTNGTGTVTFSDNNTGCASNIFAWTGYTNF